MREAMTKNISEGNSAILPKADTYWKEFEYFPWRKAIARVVDLVVENTPKGGHVLDLMSGPGYLLYQVSQLRADISLLGVDMDGRYAVHAQTLGVRIIQQDARTFTPTKRPDVLVCTGGVHHLPYEDQAGFIARTSHVIKPNGIAVFADPFIEPFASERERRIRVTQLGAAYLEETMQAGAPDDIAQAALDIIANDIRGREYKTSLEILLPAFRTAFKSVAIQQTWGLQEGFGDYVIQCSQPRT